MRSEKRGCLVLQARPVGPAESKLRVNPAGCSKDVLGCLSESTASLPSSFDAPSPRNCLLPVIQSHRHSPIRSDKCVPGFREQSSVGRIDCAPGDSGPSTFALLPSHYDLRLPGDDGRDQFHCQAARDCFLVSVGLPEQNECPYGGAVKCRPNELRTDFPVPIRKCQGRNPRRGH